MARVTLQTIADRVGVSRMTVSNAFSRPDQLSPELREHILATAQELGYVGPDPAARALARGTTGAVGVLLTDSLGDAFADDVATGFLGAVADELGPTGLALTLLGADTDGEIVPARDVAVDGAVVYSCRPRSEAVEWLRRREIPMVHVDQDPVPGSTSVNVDDRGGAAAAAAHVLGLGHRRIGLVVVRAPGSTGPDDSGGDAGALAHPVRERLRGWRETFAAAGIEPTVVRADANTAAAAAVVAAPLLSGPDRPTAVLCFSDVLALGVLRAASDAGLAVPGDLSVVGFDDNPVGRLANPPLTTVHQDVDAKGRAAAAALAAAVERNRDGRRPPRARRLVLPTQLVVRASTAAAPG